jgi:Mrp family chromosome partitioning ATPase
MVVQHNKVDKKVVKRCVVALRKATPNLLGAILNAVDLKARSYQYYYYQDADAAKVDAARAAAGHAVVEAEARPEAVVKG